MTQLEFFKLFNAEEWKLLCSRIEFLEVVTADPFDAEKTAEVANRILDTESHRSLDAVNLAECVKLTSTPAENRAHP